MGPKRFRSRPLQVQGLIKIPTQPLYNQLLLRRQVRPARGRNLAAIEHDILGLRRDTQNGNAIQHLIDVERPIPRYLDRVGIALEGQDAIWAGRVALPIVDVGGA